MENSVWHFWIPIYICSEIPLYTSFGNTTGLFCLVNNGILWLVNAYRLVECHFFLRYAYTGNRHFSMLEEYVQAKYRPLTSHINHHREQTLNQLFIIRYLKVYMNI